MKKIIQNMTGSYQSTASVIDGNLIISLPDAKAPVVWRMDMNKVKTSSLEVRHDDKEGFVLTFKSEKGENEDIAPFDSRAKAVKALMTISRAMQHSHGHIPAMGAGAQNNGETRANAAPVYNNVPAQKSGTGKIFGSLAGIALLGLLLYVFVSMSPNTPLSANADNNTGGAYSSTTGQTDSGAGNETGMPESADSFLMGR